MEALHFATYLVALVYVLNFFALSAVAARDAGRPIWLLGRAGGDRHARGLVLRVAFATALLWPGIRLLTGGIADGPAPWAFSGTAIALLGHLLAVVGAALAVLSQHHMGASWRVGAAAGELGALVRTGPFALSRNPVFVGQGLLLLGLALAFPDAVQIAAVLAALWAIAAQVRVEEAALRATFGPAYEAYARRVPRWIGRVRRSDVGEETARAESPHLPH